MAKDVIVGVFLILLSALSWWGSSTLFRKLQELKKAKKSNDGFYENTSAGITAAIILFLLQTFVDNTFAISMPSFDSVTVFFLTLLVFLINIIFICSVTLLGVLVVYYMGRKLTRPKP